MLTFLCISFNFFCTRPPPCAAPPLRFPPPAPLPASELAEVVGVLVRGLNRGFEVEEAVSQAFVVELLLYMSYFFCVTFFCEAFLDVTGRITWMDD